MTITRHRHYLQHQFELEPGGMQSIRASLFSPLLFSPQTEKISSILNIRNHKIASTTRIQGQYRDHHTTHLTTRNLHTRTNKMILLSRIAVSVGAAVAILATGHSSVIKQPQANNSTNTAVGPVTVNTNGPDKYQSIALPATIGVPLNFTKSYASVNRRGGEHNERERKVQATLAERRKKGQQNVKTLRQQHANSLVRKEVNHGKLEARICR